LNDPEIDYATASEIISARRIAHKAEPVQPGTPQLKQAAMRPLKKEFANGFPVAQAHSPGSAPAFSLRFAPRGQPSH